MIVCRKNDVSQATLRPARTLNKHWQRRYREIRDWRGKGGRGVMHVVLHVGSIGCVFVLYIVVGNLYARI